MHHGDWTIVGFTKDQVPVSTPRFEPDEGSIDQIKKKLGYSNVCNIIDVKLDTNMGILDNRLQLGIYSRQIFHEQVNRRFVECFVISPEWMRFYTFDHCGPSYFEDINIHFFPHLFIFAVLLLYADDETIGLDTTVEYNPSSPRSLKASATYHNIKIIQTMPISVDSDALVPTVFITPSELPLTFELKSSFG